MKINVFSLAAALLVSLLVGSNVGQAQVPTISVGPINQMLAVGGTLTMSVTASGGTPLAYQWFKDSRLISGATKSTLTVTGAGVTNSGMYYVVVTNLGGMAISFPSSVVVGNPSVMAWGWNNNGQLGNGSTNNTSLPVSVASNVVAGAVGLYHSLFVTADGTLWAMGNNQYGQLGNGTNTEASLPVSVASNVVAVAAGLYHSLFVTANGTLWATGNNQYGQLGNGTTNGTSLPVSVASNVVAVAAGSYQSLFVTANGTLWTMGNNLYGQLGNGTYYNTNLPVSVASNVVAVAAGAAHSLFVTANGTLWAMGYNNYGQLGTYELQVSIPQYVASNVVAVAAGASHSLFITTNGTLWAMGLNAYGQLGNGTADGDGANPTPVSVASNVVAVAAGEYHSLFLKTDGTLWGMGYNGYGQLGNGTTNEENTPVNVPQLYAANVFPGSWASHSLATAITLYPPTITSAPTNQVLAVGGTLTLSVTAATVYPAGPPVYQWFKDSRRLMGATNSTLTVANAGVTNSGTYYVAATNADGMVISTPVLVAVGNPVLSDWGYNFYGQLGDGTTTNAQTIPIGLAANVVAGAAGEYHSLFVTADGTLWAMGNNADGQLGTGTYTSTNLPVSVASNVVAVAAGDYHSLFVKSDGTLWVMGGNSYGQLGYGPTARQYTPVSVASNVVAVAAGWEDSFFLKADGTLWSMGYDEYGQLGTGTNTGSDINPLPLKVASDVVAVAAGDEHSLFVKADGTLWAAGYNYYGELGNGTASNTNLPVIVASNVVAVAAGGYHSLFVKTNGTLWAMGFNGYGQLGNGTTGNQDTPVSVGSNVVAVAAGFFHSLFVMTNGTLWVMGDNSNGELGNGTTTEANTPINVGNVSAANVFPADQAEHSLVMGSIAPTVTLGNLSQTYTGDAINVTVATTPAGLTVNLTYDGSIDAPTNVGAYTVMATINDPIFSGSFTNTLIIIPAGLTNQVVPVGGTGILNASGGGTAQTYQWFKDGHLILGATNNPLILENAGVTDSGTYFVVMTNSNGMIISLPASVAVGNPELLAWGYDAYGQLGNGTTANALSTPGVVTADVVAAAAGQDHSLFVTADGRLWAMGYNNYGQLGNGTTTEAKLPVGVASNVLAVAAGQYHSLFVKTDGTLWAMGLNVYGQLGNGTNNTVANPTPILIASNVVTIAAGEYHSLFLTTDGTLWAMGQNAYGQLGNGTSNTTNLPVRVAGNVMALAAGAYHSLFIKTDGTLWAMGDNLYGQLGNSKNDGNANANPTPAIVASNVVAVAAGAYHSLFVRNDGTLWAVGWNVYGQWGNGTTNNADTPVDVASNVVAVAAGYGQSLFVKTDGTLWAMGYNANGQLGNGATNNATLPICIPWLSYASIFPADMAYHSLALGVIYTANSITLPGGVPTLDFLGMPGVSYNVERSTDLINWSVIWTTNEPANGILQFTDPDAPLSNAYYQLQPSQ
jgi:alpha-tubulin suppressor-like RCC1 family protein